MSQPRLASAGANATPTDLHAPTPTWSRIGRANRLPPCRSSAPRCHRVHLPIDPLHRRERANDRAFLPAAPIGDLVAGHVETALRRRQHFGLRAEGGIALVGPAEACELHVVPTDRKALRDLAGIPGMQLFALLLSDLQALGDGPCVETLRRRAVYVGTGQHALRSEESRGWIPDLRDDVGCPRNAAINLLLGFPEAIGLKAHLAGGLHRQPARRVHVGGR